jgi:hypothetical protein
MKLKLQARDLWDVIEYGDGDFHDDRTALDAICSAVPSEMISALAVKETATEAWEAIRTLRLGDERRRAVTAQSLRAEYETLKLRDGEPIEDFALWFTGIVQRLGDLGDPEPDTKAVNKFLRIVRPRYKQLVISMEDFVDLSQLSIEEITGTLKSSDDVEEEAAPPQSHSTSNQLLLTHEEWMARMKLGDKGASSSSGGSAGSAGKQTAAQRGRDRGAGGAHQGAGRTDSSGQAKKPRKCKYCGKKGHWAKECRSRLRDEAHLAQAEEVEEPVLLMAQGSLTSDPLPSRSTSPAASTAAAADHQALEVVEAKVFAQLDNGDDDRDDSVWHLDTGATNHMSGSRSAFQEIDTKVRGVVRFGDGSAVPIEGAGTVILEGKNGEHTPITGVYFIPRLTTNIISLGQLDEGDCDVHIKHGILRIRDENQRLLAKVRCSGNRLYKLRVKVARPLCLAARRDEPWLCMSGTGICTSRRCGSSGRTRWCTFISSAVDAPPPSSRGGHSPLKPSGAPMGSSIWSMVTSVAPSPRRRWEERSFFCCLWMITAATCGSLSWRTRVMHWLLFSSSKLASRWRRVDACESCALTTGVNSPLSPSPSTASRTASSISTQLPTLRSRTGSSNGGTSPSSTWRAAC